MTKPLTQATLAAELTAQHSHGSYVAVAIYSRYYTEEEIENKLYWKAIGEEISLYPESVNTDVYYQNDKLKSAKELLIYHSNFGCIYIPNINQYVVQTQIRSEYFWVTVSVSFQKDEGRIAYKIIAKGSSENFSSNRIVGVAYR